MRRTFGSAIVLLWIYGCGSSPPVKVVVEAGPPKDAGPSIATVAAEFATADCTKKFACMPYATVTRAFGDTPDDCTMEETGYWTRALSAPGVSKDYSGILACVQTLGTATCQQYLDSTYGPDPSAMPACSAITPGTLETGKGCVYARQCASGISSAPDGVCGKCIAPVETLGGTCDPVKKRCDPAKGLLCAQANDTCAHPGSRGAKCTDDGDCFYNLFCSTTTMTCDDYPSAGGGPCEPADGPPGDGLGCSFQFGPGLWCNQMSSVCESPNMNGLGGAACGINDMTGGLTLCGVGFLCSGPADSFTGKCIPAHASPPGGPCTFAGVNANGPACEAEGQCVKSKCVVADPTACH